jgi:acetyltransferase
MSAKKSPPPLPSLQPSQPTKQNQAAHHRAHDVTSTHFLTPLFVPHSVAIVGATMREGALGNFVLRNMLASGFTGTIYPVNPKHKTVMGKKCYASITDLPEAPDLVVVASPAQTVANVMRDAGVRGTKAALVLSAGFQEIGEEGRVRAAFVLAELQRHGIRMVGPNCVGIMRPSIGLNATFANDASTHTKRGSLALVAQSGAVCTAILDWAATTEIGFSSVISLGGALDCDFGEVLDFLVHDTETKSILMYVEGVRDARRFMSALRAASRVKPVVLLKAGRNQSGKAAVTSHTGALAGSDRVWDAALARAGVVRVQSSLQLFAAARVLANPRLARCLKGNRLAIVTNGGGPGVVAADCADANQLTLATLTPATIEKLNAALPPHWSHANPIDIIGDATPERFHDALAIVLDDANVDAVLTMYCPQSITTADAAASAVIPLATNALTAQGKPVFASWLGGASIIAARQLFEEAGVANFLTPENAVDAFSYLAQFRQHQHLLLQSPPATGLMSFHELAKSIATAKRIRDHAIAEKRTILREMEAKELLAAFHLPVHIGVLAHDRAEAEKVARQIGFPVVLKIDSPDITHKSDAGGVRLNLINTRQVGEAFDAIIASARDAKPEANIRGVNIQPMLKFAHSREVLVGISRDATFGPIISFGAGGVAVEAIADTALALPPLNTTLAENLIAGTRIAKLLAAYRNIPGIDEAALTDIIVRVSTIACALPWVRELDLNPVLAHPHGAAIVDARIVIDRDSPITDTRYRHMAIFPYPVALERELRLRDNTPVHMRAIRPDDATRERAFVAAMSETSRYYRFLHSVQALSDEMIARFTQLDYDREMALIALLPDESEIVGVARYHSNADGKSCEFAIAIADKWQAKGLGEALMQNLIACAREAGYAAIEGSVLHGNIGMLKLAARLGFQTEQIADAREMTRVVLQFDNAN